MDVENVQVEKANIKNVQDEVKSSSWESLTRAMYELERIQRPTHKLEARVYGLIADRMESARFDGLHGSAWPAIREVMDVRAMIEVWWLIGECNESAPAEVAEMMNTLVDLCDWFIETYLIEYPNELLRR